MKYVGSGGTEGSGKRTNRLRTEVLSVLFVFTRFNRWGLLATISGAFEG
jgi:hypothetical protein